MAEWYTLPKAQQPNRRQSARGRLFMLVAPNDHRAALWAWDIGLGGMQCRSRDFRPTGTTLQVRFALPGTTDFIDASVRVRSVDTVGLDDHVFGVGFVEIARGDILSIYRFLDGRRPLWEEPSATARSEVPPPIPVRKASDDARPFSALLVEAFNTLHRTEQRGLRYVKQGPSPALRQLGNMLGAPLQRKAG